MPVSFSSFADQCIAELEDESRFSTARLYRSSHRSLREFLGGREVSFRDINPHSMKRYQQRLAERHYMPNTVSTYIRMLRAIYNKAVDADLTPFVRNIFRDVYTGVDTSHKKALDTAQIGKLLFTEVKSPALRRTQHLARAIYQLCGIPFVDITHVDFSTVHDGTLRYSRRKTGACISIQMMKDTAASVSRLDLPHHDMSTAEGYRAYQSQLRNFNASLSRLAKAVGLKCHVSSYTLRHSWATVALHCHVPIEVISSALGHADIRTTQIYLKGFNAREIGEANRKVFRSVSPIKQ